MKFDEILINYLGEFGRYQKIQFFLVCIPTIFTALHSLSWTFTSAIVPHRCFLPDENETTPFDLALFPNKSLAVDLEDLKCQRVRDWNISSYFREDLTPTTLVPCERYKWDHSEIEKTAISEWEIVCGRKWIRAFVQSMYYVGQFFGSFVFGILGDKMGRKRVFLVAIMSQMTCGVAMAFVPHWVGFAILRVLVGFCHSGIFVIAVVIGMELVGPSKRKLAGVITGVFYAVGQVILGAVAFALRNYEHIQLAISIPDLFFIAYWWLVPESARWLLSKGRIEEADEILQRAAKVNRVNLPENWFEDVEIETKEPKDQNVTVLDLFRTASVRRRMLILLFCWPVVSGVYYGLSMNPTFLGGDRYVTFIAAGFMEIPGLVFVYLTMERWGRKPLCVGGYLLTAGCLLSTLLIPSTIQWLKIVQVVVSKMCITSVYAVMYTFTPELFPTSIRNTALGCCSMMARVGAVSASYVSMWLVYHSRVAMVLLFGSFCLTAGLLALFLPETAGRPLPETMEDVQSALPRNKFWICCRRQEQQEAEECHELHSEKI